MKAIFVTGGKQYYVGVGDEIYVEKINAEVSTKVEFTDVLYVDGITGKPNVKNAKGVCEVLKHGKNKKIIVFKYRPKKKYRNKHGHRQPYTKLKVVDIITK